MEDEVAREARRGAVRVYAHGRARGRARQATQRSLLRQTRSQQSRLRLRLVSARCRSRRNLFLL